MMAVVGDKAKEAMKVRMNREISSKELEQRTHVKKLLLRKDSCTAKSESLCQVLDRSDRKDKLKRMAVCLLQGSSS